MSCQLRAEQIVKDLVHLRIPVRENRSPLPWLATKVKNKRLTTTELYHKILWSDT